MTLAEFKNQLPLLDHLAFQTENKHPVPPHFHLTEMGRITKHFIDCGGKEQNQQLVNFQLWAAEDVNHRLTPEKLSGIIKQTQRILNIPDDLEIEIEYQFDTIGKYGLDFEAGVFVLTKKKTACLASDRCAP